MVTQHRHSNTNTYHYNTTTTHLCRIITPQHRSVVATTSSRKLHSQLPDCCVRWQQQPRCSHAIHVVYCVDREVNVIIVPVLILHLIQTLCPRSKNRGCLRD